MKIQYQFEPSENDLRLQVSQVLNQLIGIALELSDPESWPAKALGRINSGTFDPKDMAILYDYSFLIRERAHSSPISKLSQKILIEKADEFSEVFNKIWDAIQKAQ